MRLRIVSLVVLLLALTAGAQFPATQAGVEIPQSLATLVAGGGRVEVVVEIQMSFTPEGDLAGPASIGMQRDAIQRGLDDVMGRAAAAGVQVDRRFSFIPFFTARVNAEELAALAATPGVKGVSEVTYDRPLLTQSVPLIGANTSHTAGFTGAGWSVAVLDTGVDKNHPMLSGGKVVAEACYSTNDASSGASSLCPGGASSSTAANSGLPCSAAIDGCDHGTHVAGIAAGRAGVSGAPTFGGVAPGANVIAIQVFTRINNDALCGFGGSPCVLTTSTDQVFALERVLALAGAGNVNRVASANMSLGGSASATSFCDTGTNAARKAAIDNLLSIGIATAIATGNDGVTSAISSPGCISSAVSVGSTTKADAVSSFSNRRAGLVDLMAPGSGILSSVPGSQYAAFSGTSMATPHVAGAWAVLKQSSPGASVAAVLNALQSTGVAINDPLSDEDTIQAIYPRISVNAARLALGSTPPAPGPPGTPTIGGSGNNVVISWTAPTTGGAPTSYTLIARGTCGGGIITSAPVGNVLSFSTPAPNGTFCVSVRASNSVGNGPESAGTSFSVPIVGPPPGAPTNLTATTVGQTVTLSWSSPTTGGPPSGYVATVTGTISGVFPLGLTNTVTAPGLPAGTYNISVAASNSAGTGPSSNTVTFVIGATAPTMNAPSVSGGNVTFSWVNGSGGSAPTGFVLRARTAPGGPIVASLPVGGNTFTVPGVPRGTYYVSVQAVAGSLLSPESNVVTVIVP